MRRFEQPSWASTMGLMRHTYLHPRQLHLDDLLQAQEVRIAAAYDGLPGVYVLQNSVDLRQVYVGMASEDLVRRARQHTDGPYRLRGGYPTADSRSARALEAHIHSLMCRQPGIFLQPGKRGAYAFPGDVDGFEEVDHLIRSYYRHFLRQTVLTS